MPDDPDAATSPPPTGKDEPDAVARLLRAAADGRPEAARELLPLVYDELRALARARMGGERPGHTIQATALVHEAYLRLVGGGKGGGDPGWANRAHFFRAAADAMRRVLIDHARARGGPARGGGRRRVPLDVVDLAAADDPAEILALDEAISRLEADDPAAAEVVRLRFFAGMAVDDVAAATGRSPRSVKRDWAFARARLLRELRDP